MTAEVAIARDVVTDYDHPTDDIDTFLAETGTPNREMYGLDEADPNGKITVGQVRPWGSPSWPGANCCGPAQRSS